MPTTTLSDQDRRGLLRLARSVIRAKLIDTEEIARPDPVTPPMHAKRGGFVTLHKKGALRGCIGTIEPVKPLIVCVEENASNAASVMMLVRCPSTLRASLKMATQLQIYVVLDAATV